MKVSIIYDYWHWGILIIASSEKFNFGNSKLQKLIFCLKEENFLILYEKWIF